MREKTERKGCERLDLEAIIRLRLHRAEYSYWEIHRFCEDFQTASLLSSSVSASLAASSAVTTVRPSKCYVG